MAATHKAQRIEEVGTGGVARDYASGITRLAADESGEILCPGRGADIQVERIKPRTLELIQHASGENSALSAAFAHQCYLAWFVGFVSQWFNVAERDRYSVSQRLSLSISASQMAGLN